MSGAVLLQSPVERAQRFRALAEEIRATAEAMVEPDARRTMLYMADNYDSLADHIEEQLEKGAN